jgi:Rrf2 family protein
MKVSTRAEYGIRALIDLAQHYGKGLVQTQDIARHQGLPEPYLTKLLGTLRRAQLVRSRRGPKGGHMLARPPERITVGDAFLVLERSVAPWFCVEEEETDCIYAPGCGLRPVWQAVKAATEDVLNRITLADIRGFGHASHLAVLAEDGLEPWLRGRRETSKMETSDAALPRTHMSRRRRLSV